jgi:hypothetical protein
MKAKQAIMFCFLWVAVWAAGSVQTADSNADGCIDLMDLLNLTQCWLESTVTGPCQSVNVHADGLIDYRDFSLFSQAWLDADPSLYLVGRWKMDETSGTYAYDSSGNNYRGTLRNFPTSPWKSGWISNALEFDGSNDYVRLYQLDNGLGQYFVRDFTMAAWLYPADISGYQVVLGIESTSHFTTYGFEGFTLELYNGLPSIYIAYPDLIDSPYPDMNRDIVFGNTPLVVNQWQHICIVRSGPEVRFYLNGRLDAVRQVHDEDILFGSEWPGYDSIGATDDSYYGSKDFFKGKIDEVHLYNTTVSQSVVLELARQYLAWYPQPADQAAEVSTGSALKWQKGMLAQPQYGHDVYLGQDFDAVNTAARQTPEIYKGRQTAAVFDPGGLDPLAQYFWRVDEFDGTQTYKGDIWTFTTSAENFTTSCSSYQTGYPAAGACDGDRFSFAANQCWKGQSGQGSWWWQIHFEQPTQVGSILQIVGDHPSSVLNNTPLEYRWQWSQDAVQWTDLPETAIANERRLYRIHRLAAPVLANYLRIEIISCTGSFPALREVELYPETDAVISFPDWIIAVSIAEVDTLPAYYVDNFLALIAACPGRTDTQAQEIWLEDFDESYLAIEPYPLCAFLSGSFQDWCQRDREPFAGLQEVLDNENLPIWGSCGGAQAIGILLDTGYLSPWDCPRCRDPQNPYSPIYGHIGYLDPLDPGPCGDYEHAIMETGPTYVRKVIEDPAFNGLPNQFLVNESHMGQLEYLPLDWEQICGAGSGVLTELQCYKKIGKPIYGAQFHIENYNSQTWANSILIMSNFLTAAEQWGGYQAD